MTSTAVRRYNSGQVSRVPTGRQPACKIHLESEFNMANLVGKRYVCSNCGTEYIVTKAGAGTVNCCGKPTQLKK